MICGSFRAHKIILFFNKMPKRSNREMDVEHSGECSDSAAAGGESSGAAAAGQSTSSGEGPRMSRLFLFHFLVYCHCNCPLFCFVHCVFL